jgi:hypothetical protein
VLAQAREQDLLSDEHFTVDGTLLEAWASKKSYQPKAASPTEATGSRGIPALPYGSPADGEPQRVPGGGARELGITPHVAQHTKRPSSIDGRTTRHAGYPLSLKKRKRLEQIFGWLKTTGLMRKLRHRGQALVQWMFRLALSAYTLVRMRNLSVQAA